MKNKEITDVCASITEMEIGEYVYHMATGDRGVVVGYSCSCEKTGTSIKVGVSWSPELCTYSVVEELSKTRDVI